MLHGLRPVPLDAGVDRWRLGVALMLSLGLHSALFSWPDRSRRSDDWRVSPLPGRAISVRLADPVHEARPALRPAEAAGRAPQSAHGMPVPIQEAPVTPAVSEVPIEPPAPESIVAYPESEREAASGQANPAEDAASPGPESTETPDGYLPRDKLTVSPHPAEEIVVPSTIDGLQIDGGRQVGVFTLFVDVDGTVRRMVIDGPTLPPVLEALAQRTFMAARFVPGELNGRPVKALLRIEVEFGETPPAVPVSVISSQILPSPP